MSGYIEVTNGKGGLQKGQPRIIPIESLKVVGNRFKSRSRQEFEQRRTPSLEVKVRTSRECESSNDYFCGGGKVGN